MEQALFIQTLKDKRYFDLISPVIICKHAVYGLHNLRGCQKEKTKLMNFFFFNTVTAIKSFSIEFFLNVFKFILDFERSDDCIRFQFSINTFLGTKSNPIFTSILTFR